MSVVNDVVFPTDTIIDKGRLYVYYGASDKMMGSRSMDLKELIGELVNN